MANKRSGPLLERDNIDLKRPHLSCGIAPFLKYITADNVSKIDSDLEKFQLLPMCYVASGYILTCSKTAKSVSSSEFLNQFEKKFPCFSYMQRYKKRVARIFECCNKLTKHCPTTAKALIDCYNFCNRNPGGSSHENSKLSFIQGQLCSICRPEPSVSDVSLEKLLERHYITQLSEGKSPQQIHDTVSRISLSLAIDYNSRCNRDVEITHSMSVEHQNKLDKLRQQIQSLEAKSDEQLKILKTNLSHFENHLKDNSAYLHYGLNISQSQIVSLDTLFSKRPTVPDLESVVAKLPPLNNIKFLEGTTHKPAVPSVANKVFEEYLAHVLEHNSEPVFVRLGEKFNLTGIAGGKDPSRVCRYAQSICYNKLLDYKQQNPDTFEQKINPVLQESLIRENRKKFQLYDDLNIPRLPTKLMAEKIVTQMAERGDIVLGHVQSPIPINTYNYFEKREETVFAYSRKIPLERLRKHFLDQHTGLGYMRAQQDQYYDSLSREKCIEILENYGIYFESTCEEADKIAEVGKLQALVKQAETTRHFLIWWDHAELANYTYILFNFQLIYSPAVYTSDSHTTRELQKIIETPQMYFVGMGRSTYESEESYSDMRLNDCLALSNKCPNNEGIYFTDVYKFTTGDTPARCSESGQQKGGHFPIATSPLHIHNDIGSYQEIVRKVHMTVEDQQNHANKGDYYLNRLNNASKNEGKSLLDKKCSKEIAKIRLNKQFKSQEDACNALKFELHGRRHHHMLLINSPHAKLSDLNLENLEVCPCEPLHDAKGLTKKVFEILPGSIKNHESHTLAIVQKVIVEHGDEVYLLKDNHSAETVFKFLISINLHLENRLFPEGGLKSLCRECQAVIFTVGDESKCEKCLLVGFYRILLEIHIFCYKDESKRNGQSVLRLYNLTYLLMHFTQALCKKFPDSEITKIVENVYFINIVKYLPVCFQFVSALTINAGRHEADFQKFKQAILNFSNRQHFSPSLLLNAEKRLAVSKFYSKTTHTKSQVSKQVDKLITVSPPLDITFTKKHIDSENEGTVLDFSAHLERIACFLVSNDSNQYVIAKPNGDFVFPTLTCNCNIKSDACTSCKSEKFPPYPIHNIFNSSIAKVINTNMTIYKSISSKFLVDGRIIIPSLAKIVDQKSTVSCSENRNVSKNVVDSISVTSNTLQPFLQGISEKPVGYTNVKYSKSVMLLALLYGHVDDDLLRMDKVCFDKNRYMKRFAHNLALLKDSEDYHDYHRQYIGHIRKHIRLLKKLQDKLGAQVNSLSGLVDEETEHISDFESFDQLQSVKDLKITHFKRLGASHLLNNFQHESNANLHIDLGLDV